MKNIDIDVFAKHGAKYLYPDELSIVRLVDWVSYRWFRRLIKNTDVRCMLKRIVVYKDCCQLRYNCAFHGFTTFFGDNILYTLNDAFTYGPQNTKNKYTISMWNDYCDNNNNNKNKYEDTISLMTIDIDISTSSLPINYNFIRPRILITMDKQNSCSLKGNSECQPIPILTSIGRLVDSVGFMRVNIVVRFNGMLGTPTETHVEYSADHVILGCEIIEVVDDYTPIKFHPVGPNVSTDIPSNSEALRRIKDSFEDMYGIYQIVRTCKAMITGSYLLQIVHNECYKNSDIDIFCPVSSVLLLQTELLSFPGISYVGVMKGPTIDDCGYIKNNKKIKMVMNLMYYDKLIQIIAVECEDVCDFIENTFDLSFCKLRTNGVDIYPEDLGDICRRYGTLELGGNDILYTRLLKYAYRGYRFNLTSNGKRLG